MNVTLNLWLVLAAASIQKLCLPFPSGKATGFVNGFEISALSPQRPNLHSHRRRSQSSVLCAATPLESSKDDVSPAGAANASLKRDLLQLAASYDRGYGATRRAFDAVDALVSDLEGANPEQNAIRGIDGSDGDDVSPLDGSWRMVWTTAADVLTLSANPLVAVGAIYQVFDPPCVTNVIDLLPPFRTLLGDQMGSVLRAKVTTRAYRPKSGTSNNRIGLDFERVALEPVELLGNDVGFLPPLGFTLPRTPFEGFFDVTYLDDELLIIRQNAPGGMFVLAKVDNFDP